VIALLIIAVSVSAFGDYFEVEYRIPIPEKLRISGEGGWTDWSYCSVNPAGDAAAFIDPEARQVVVYDIGAASASVLAGNFDPSYQQFFFSSVEMEVFDLSDWINTIARNGRKTDEVNLPLAINYSPAGELLISDMGARRILHFSSEGDLIRSFLLTGQVAAPNEIRYHPDGIYIAAGLNLDPSSAINGGNFCTLFSADGQEIGSFAYTPQIALDRNLWVGVSAVLDIDDSGLVYLSFSVEGDVYVYDITGTLRRRFGHRPTWFADPRHWKSRYSRSNGSRSASGNRGHASIRSSMPATALSLWLQKPMGRFLMSIRRLYWISCQPKELCCTAGSRRTTGRSEGAPIIASTGSHCRVTTF